VNAPKNPYRIEPLGKHNRAAFSCGKPELDRYLRERAGQEARRRVTAPFVAVVPDTGAIAGYYTLSALSVSLGYLPPDVARRLPRYPAVPATLLGRLAVDRQHQRKGLGEFLLMDALRRSLDETANVGSVAVVVDALDDEARAFYEHFDFIRLPEQPTRLFLPMATIAKLF